MRIRATVDRSTIRAERSDLAYVVVEVVDVQGQRVPDAREELSFKATGSGALEVVGTGDPTDVRLTSSACTRDGRWPSRVGPLRSYDRLRLLLRQAASSSL